MTKEELISHYCDYRGKCTTDDVTALTFAYRMLAPRWISVEDELPKKDGDILVYCADGVGVWEYDKSYNGQDMNDYNHITHWMPLPQPPSSSEKPNNLRKEEDNEGKRNDDY